MELVNSLNTIIDYIKKYYSLIAYMFFGVCTTVINIVVYKIMYSMLNIANIPANIIAWIAAVIFAYITNKLFVFDSKSFNISVLLHELIAFISCRLLTGVLDLSIMFVAVDIMYQSEIFWKIISNIFVIVINYIASKIVIFKKNNN